MTKEQKVVIDLVRLAFGDKIKASSISEFDWATVVETAMNQGVLAICLDGLQYFPKDGYPDIDTLMDWVGQAKYQISQYVEHEKTVFELSAFYGKNNINVLLLKGLGLSLNYPNPQSRPSGDIDIYLFGEKDRADELISKEKGIIVDTDYQFHSRFNLNGIVIENHSAFFDENRHNSDIFFQRILKDQLDYDINNDRTIKSFSLYSNLYFPSPTWNALFVLRHAGEHFASEKITLRHVLDIGSFFQKHSGEIDWKNILNVYEKENIKTFYDSIATICVNYIGFRPEFFVGYNDNMESAKRILEDIFASSEDLPMSSANIKGLAKLKYGVNKSLRWWNNRWKYKMVFNESLWSSFWTLAKNRIRN